MGLDITFYENATPTEPHERTDDCYDADNHVSPYRWPDFQRTQYEIDESRCYTTSGREIDWGMSYGGYSLLRRFLTSWVRPGLTPEEVWADPATYADLPLVELINFADNEGGIGPLVAATIATDFDLLDPETFPDIVESDLGWKQRVRELSAGFHLAADTGLVNFG